MFFILGIDTREQHIGNATNIICPACGALTCMRIAVFYNLLHLFFIPVFKWNRRYFASAHCCGAVFELDREEGTAFERGRKSSIDPAHLHRTYGYSDFPGTCTYCGAQLPVGARFCSQCGRPVR